MSSVPKCSKELILSLASISATLLKYCSRTPYCFKKFQLLDYSRAKFVTTERHGKPKGLILSFFLYPFKGFSRVQGFHILARGSAGLLAGKWDRKINIRLFLSRFKVLSSSLAVVTNSSYSLCLQLWRRKLNNFK